MHGYNFHGKTDKSVNIFMSEFDKLVDEILVDEGLKSTLAATALAASTMFGVPTNTDASQVRPSNQTKTQQLDVKPSMNRAKGYDMRNRKNLPRGIRNNNPGNIERSKDKWNGSVTNPSENRFVTFETTEMGIRALGIILRNYQKKYGINTIEGIIMRWAPPKENNTAAYIKLVSQLTGLKPKQKINLNDIDTLYLITKAIIIKENSQKNLPPFKVILDGLEMALKAN
jgi:hypothetical protein